MYEAAVTSAAFIGFNMGSTATAMANMQAITNKYGPAPQSYLIVPLSGAFFIDIMNAFLLTADAGASIHWRVNMRALLNALVTLILAACGAGPDESALSKDVAERVTQALPAGTVTMASLSAAARNRIPRHLRARRAASSISTPS